MSPGSSAALPGGGHFAVMGQPMNLKSMAGWAQFHGLRALERLLPPTVLWLALWPSVACAALCDLAKQGRYYAKWRQVPASLLPSGPGFFLFRSARMKLRFGRLPTFWPDRLAQARWQQRCRYEGLDTLASARQGGTPIVLATLHFGQMVLMRYLLRARDIPVAGLAEEARARRPRLQHLKDAKAPLPGVPHVFPLEELKQARQFLLQGGCLLVPMDAPRGKQVEIQTPHGVLRLGTGAIRLAQSTGAQLVPCLIYEESPWRFVVHCGKPANLGAPSLPAGLEAVGQDLARELLPVLARHPDHWGANLMEAWRKADNDSASIIR